MRVALVIQKIVGLRGGAERIILGLAHELARRGHEPVVLTYELAVGEPAYDATAIPIVDLFPDVARSVLRSSTTLESPDAGRVVEHRLTSRVNHWPLTRLKWEATHGLFARRLARYLTRHPQDVVVGFLPPAISAVSIAATRLGDQRPRTIASTHNVPNEDFGNSMRWDQNPIARETNVWALTVADAVTVLQPEFVAQLPGAARERAVVLSNPVERLAPPTGRPREPVILGVGRLTEVKRFDTLIEAFGRIAADVPEWSVVIYGEGPERQRLEQLVDRLGLGARVRLPGSIGEIADEYDRARILCHPARFEGFGLSVAEGVLHGLIVVASRYCDGANRLVQDGATGVLVDDSEDEIGSFARGLLRAIEHPPPEAARRAAAARLSERLSPSAIYDQWERLLTPP